MHGQKGRHPDDLYATAHRLSVEFISVNTAPVHTHSPSSTHWCPPPPGKLKLNVDGACSTFVWKCGLGAVVRNVHGDLLGAISVPITGCFSAKITELLAIRKGLQFAWEANYDSLVVETDAKNAINDIISGTEAFEAAGGIINDIHMLSRNFESLSFVFAPKLRNTVADRLAKFTLGSVSIDVWLEEGPPWFNVFLQANANNLELS
ncbi:PREDICTED: uncharacterized protein LOC103328904 [Prunus mume]|uniref:Uncharacterized protein LOC103328904 n=1 Tax=Prunus mume TaxID=102107 RepID=A0ABM0NTC9_PRUMU|nr:PREDICTED: uncharacterized protein LOC103328904 [Prunus mume]